MAAVTWVCLCGIAYPDDVEVCELDGTTRPEAPTRVVPTDAPPQPARPQPGPGDTAKCRGCGRVNGVDATHCFRCTDPLPFAGVAAGGASLVLPDGTVVRLEDETPLVLGRESHDPAVSHALALHDQVSRRHAEIALIGGAVRIRDLGSTNGTYVDDLPVVGESTVPLGAGVRLRFGRELEIAVTPGGAL